jgi:hypothetical protein
LVEVVEVRNIFRPIAPEVPARCDQVPMMAQMQNIIDCPPAPKLDPMGRLYLAKATEQELAGEQLFLGKGRCASCHPPQTSSTIICTVECMQPRS